MPKLEFLSETLSRKPQTCEPRRAGCANSSYELLHLQVDSCYKTKCWCSETVATECNDGVPGASPKLLQVDIFALD